MYCPSYIFLKQDVCCTFIYKVGQSTDIAVSCFHSNFRCHMFGTIARHQDATYCFANANNSHSGLHDWEGIMKWAIFYTYEKNK